MRDERGLKNAKVVCDGWPAYFAGEIFNFGEILTEAGFSYPPHASEPDDGSLLSRSAEQVQPEATVYRMQLYLHIIALNVNTFLNRPCWRTILLNLRFTLAKGEGLLLQLNPQQIL
jgi:hypothetical protein